MKNNNRYSKISSFEDFRIEKENLKFQSELIEAKLSLNYLHFRKALSISTLFSSLAKEFVLPKVSDFLGVLIKKIPNTAHTESEK